MYNMPYFKNENILLIHIPKTGGSSVEKYFCDKYNINLTIDNLYSNSDLRLNNHSLQHSTYSEIKSYLFFNINFNNIKIITVVRNPYDRIISDLFFYKLINKKTEKEKIASIIDMFLKSNEIKFDNHKMEQYKYLINNDDEIISDKIIIMKTETLNEDMEKNGFANFNIIINNTYRNTIDYRSLLNNDSIKLINDYYKKDFEYFNYKTIQCQDENQQIVENEEMVEMKLKINL